MGPLLREEPPSETVDYTTPCSSMGTYRDPIVIMPTQDGHNDRDLDHTLALLGPMEVSSSNDNTYEGPTGTPAVRTEPQAPQQSPPRENLPREIVERVEHPQRSSTQAQYAAKIVCFKRWCAENSHSSTHPSIETIALFYQFLFDKKLVQPSTIRGYTSALADFYPPVVLDIANSVLLKRLVRSYFRDRPPALHTAPDWDLLKVLDHLSGPLFEPLAQVSIKYLTLKCSFLIALASGRRRSEIHAFDFNNIFFSHTGGSCLYSIQTNLNFLAKNQPENSPALRGTRVIIPALATVDTKRSLDPTGNPLCPVRALKIYIKRTARIRRGRKLLFLSIRPNFKQEISPITISSWLKQTIQSAYAQPPSDPRSGAKKNIKAHQVRSAASTWKLQGGSSMRQIMEACYWRSHTSFTRHYLKQHWVNQSDRTKFTLGSFVAAGSTVDPLE